MPRTGLLAALLLLLLTVLSPASLAHATPDGRPLVAVLYFDYDGQDKDLAQLKKGLAQMLITDLSNVDKVTLVERERLEAIMAELNLQQTAAIDKETAVKIGKLLGAHSLLTGHYMAMYGKLYINARIIDVQTGRDHDGIKLDGPPEDFLSAEQKISDHFQKIFALETEHGAVPPTSPKPTPGAAPSPPRPAPKVKPPSALKTKTALAYSRALDAIDHKDKAAAKKELTAVLKEQPDFKLAQLDLDRLVR